MRKLAAGLIAGTFALPGIAADSLEDVLACHYETRGGLENIRQVESARFNGTMTMGAMEAPYEIEFKKPEKVRLEFEIQGMTAVQAYDGSTGWSVMPFMGKTAPEEMPEDEVKNVKQMADFSGPLVDWKDKGHELTYKGTEDVQGTEAHVIHVVRDNGDEETHYLDTEYCLTFMEKATREIQGNEMKITAEIGNYKPLGDLVIPHSITQTMGEGPQAPSQTITIDEGSFDVDIPDDRFAMPEVQETTDTDTGAAAGETSESDG